MTLEAQMRQLVAELLILSHGTTANWSPTGRGGEEITVPPGESSPPHLFWAERWDRAVKRDAEMSLRVGAIIKRHRIDVVEAASVELESWRKRTAPKVVEETADQLAGRVVSEGRGISLKEIASHCRCSETFARRARVKANVDPGTGMPLGPIADTVDASQRARELADRGMKQRQIALILNRSQATVSRLVGKA